MSKYFYKAEFKGVTYLRSSNGLYKVAFPNPRSIRAGITVTASNASWSYDDKRIASAKGSRVILEAQEITEQEFRALSKIGRAQAKALEVQDKANFDKAWAEYKTQNNIGA